MTTSNNRIECKQHQTAPKVEKPVRKELPIEKPVERPKRKAGRPKGSKHKPPAAFTAAKIREFQQEVIHSKRLPLVLNKMFDIALDDDHPQQVAMIKFLGDRVLHQSYFEKDKDSHGTSAIQINISTVDAPAHQAQPPHQVERVIDHQPTKKLSVNYDEAGDIEPDDPI